MRKTFSIVSKSAAKWIDSLPYPLLLSRPLDNGLVAREIGHPLSANSNNIPSAVLFHSPCGLSSLIEDHFFSEPGPRKNQCPAPNLLAYIETSRAFDSHSFSLFFDSLEMLLNIKMKIILPVKFSGLSFDLNSKSLTSWLSCNVVNPEKIFHSNSIGSPSILSKFLYSWDVLNHSNLCSNATIDWEFSCILPRHNTEPEKT